MAKLLQILIWLCISSASLVYGGNNGSPEKKSESLVYNLVDGLPDICISPITEKIGVTWSNGYIWDKPLIQKFYSRLPADDFFIVFDLGAQTGSFSLLAKYFPNSSWYAFEPLQEAADTLKENLLLNDIHNVSVYQIAASDFSGKTNTQNASHG